MNPLAWFQRGEKKSGNTWDVFRAFFESEAKAGPATAAQAMKVATVFAIARVYANGLAQVPMKLMLAQANGGGDPARSHKLYNIIALRPNEWQTSFMFRQTVGMHLAMANNAYVYIVRVGNRIVELLPFPPETVSAKQSKDRRMQYRVRLADGSFLDVDQAHMWHLRNLSWDGVTGLDAVRMARNAIGLAESTEEHGRKFWSNGARVSGVLSSEQVLNEPQLEMLRDSWKKAYGGTENAGKTAVLGMGMKYQPTAMQADHSQYAETRKMQAEEICRGFGVLPIMIGISDKATTYASAEAMYQAHVTNTLMPLYENVVQSAMVNLLTPAEIAEGYYFHLSANALLRGNTKDRGAFYWQLWQMGVLNPNEIRALEEMNPREGGEAYYVPVNMAPSDKPLGEPDQDPSKTEPST
jgi:HK97 family phage portal protein